MFTNGLSRLRVAEDARLEPLLMLRDVGDSRIIAFMSMLSAESGEIDKARF